ncbi:MAG: histidine kinase [Chthoniobacteraceae bacterium]|nr:histidine kinase [Chthoniobacteraceae bacterium]
MLEPLRSHLQLDQLRENRLFTGVDTEVIAEIGAAMHLMRLAEGDVLFEEGDPGDCLYIICNGTIRISKLGRAGKQETLGLVQAGDFFGEMALIDGQPRSAQAVCVEPSLLGLLDRSGFEQMLLIAPSRLHMNFLRSVVGRLREGNEHFMTELIRNERLALVGTMANSIIHDLKNPMCVICGCAELISSKAPDPTVKKLTDTIGRAVDNMFDMTQELLDFARGRSSLELRRTCITALMEEVDPQINHLVPETITLAREVHCTAFITADTGRFARMLLNLVKNSIEAMNQGGMLSLSVRQKCSHVVFRISDTGCGIPAELQARIFEPFVSFGKSQGTGLGMAIVKSVVEAHSGTISVHSEVGVGTEVEVSIPILQSEKSEAG